ncbi:uncharacterized protein LOC128963769 [Oppia nitens]|uniref:uncharacterized protein LOC128963769 n=1 Tax=Oppia nitens TaxID=1686743 RepID=UPI0023DB44F2|nr:uncharacterized protein LOC128963769 [Oppia nitens]
MSDSENEDYLDSKKRKKSADRQRIADKRLKDKESRDREKEADKQRKADKRLKDKESRDREKEADKQRKADKRLKDKESRDREKEADKQRKADKRLKDKESRDREKEAERHRKAEKRIKDKEFRDLEKKFEDAKLLGPTEICSCCGCLWFITQIRSFNIVNFTKLNDNEKAQIDFFNLKENCHFCNTCYQDILKSKIPRLSLSHGLMFPEIPECLNSLNDLEERMVSARIIFETILHLPKGGQYKMKGNVVNVPVDPNAMLPLLPRIDDELHIIRVQLKRRINDPPRLDNKDLYKTVRPHELKQALNFLIKQSAYINAGVKLKHDWYKRFPKEFSQINESEEDKLTNNIINDDDDIVGCLDTLLDSDDPQVGVAYAPGEGKKPLNILIDINAASLAFPKLFAGQERPLITKTMKFSVADYAKSELRRHDRRCAENIPYLFFTFKRKQWNEAISATNIFKRKIKGQAEWSVNDALDSTKVNKAIASDKAFKSMSKLRTSPSYWEQKRDETIAMIRQLGLPTLFFTLSAAESSWDELLVILSKVLNNMSITLEEANNLQRDEKLSLIRPFGNKRVIESYYRVEFQHRGSPHIHGLLWLSDAPKYDKNNDKSNDDVINFIDEITSTSTTAYYETDDEEDTQCVDEDTTNLINTVQIHRHKDNCLKVKNTSSIKREEIFLRRLPNAVNINAYNQIWLKLWRANIDIQYCLHPYACVKYLCAYISKSMRGMSLLLKQASEEAKKGNKTIQEQVRHLANTLVNGTEISAQEAVYHALSMDISRMSRVTMFINNGPPNERFQMLKSRKDLEEMPGDSKDISIKGLLDHYMARPVIIDIVNNLCLAEFAASYNYCKSISSKLLESNKIDFDFDDEETNDEKKDLKDDKCKDLYESNIDTIKANLKLFDPQLLETELFNVINANDKENDANDINENSNDEISKDHEILNIRSPIANIFDETDESKESTSKSYIDKITVPKIIDEDEYRKMMRSLNIEQRNITMDILHRFKTGKTPFNIILMGSAGVGKSHVLKCIYQSIIRFINTIQGTDLDSIKILITAYTGKAAWNVDGITLHAALAFPHQQISGGNLNKLSADTSNTMRCKLKDLKLLVIDEISLCSNKIFNWIDKRLKEIFQNTLPFGGISILLIGDLHQAKPVGGGWPFKEAKDGYNAIIGPYLWRKFKSYELSIVMRQKNDIYFVDCLNRLANAALIENDIKLLKSRFNVDDSCKNKSVCLYYTNNEVALHNTKAIEDKVGELLSNKAIDDIRGYRDINERQKIIDKIEKLTYQDTNGLMNNISFKIGLKYMITCNVDVSDGLFNGAFGTLMRIDKDKYTSNINTIWLQFPKNSGLEIRRKYMEYIKQNFIPNNWTPIEPIKKDFQMGGFLNVHVTRLQFPLVCCESMTIHKSQGSTFEQVIVNLTKHLPRELIYTACSRVTSINGLYLDGDFKLIENLKPRQSDMEIFNEIQRLQSEARLQMIIKPLECSIRKDYAITYLNVQSIRKNILDLQYDDNILASDLLILVETRSKCQYNLLPNIGQIYHIPFWIDVSIDVSITDISSQSSDSSTKQENDLIKPLAKQSKISETMSEILLDDIKESSVTITKLSQETIQDYLKVKDSKVSAKKLSQEDIEKYTQLQDHQISNIWLSKTYNNYLHEDLITSDLRLLDGSENNGWLNDSLITNGMAVIFNNQANNNNLLNFQTSYRFQQNYPYLKPKYYFTNVGQELHQIVNTGNHWIYINVQYTSSTTITCNVYDSVNTLTVSELIVRVASAHIRQLDITPQLKYQFWRVTKQPNSNDCGVYALMNMALNISGINPSSIRQTENSFNLRQRLQRWYESGQISLPITRNTEAKSKYITIPTLHCLCSKTFNNNMIRCTQCGERFHQNCQQDNNTTQSNFVCTKCVEPNQDIYDVL